MREYDTQLLDYRNRPLVSYGPCRMEPGDGKDVVIGCAPAEAQFWGVYQHPRRDVEAEHLADAHDQESAKRMAEAIQRGMIAEDALRGLLDQLQLECIYIPGTEEGHWDGLEGLSFTEAEAAIAQAKPASAAPEAPKAVPGEYTLTDGYTATAASAATSMAPMAS